MVCQLVRGGIKKIKTVSLAAHDEPDPLYTGITSVTVYQNQVDQI